MDCHQNIYSDSFTPLIYICFCFFISGQTHASLQAISIQWTVTSVLTAIISFSRKVAILEDQPLIFHDFDSIRTATIRRRKLISKKSQNEAKFT